MRAADRRPYAWGLAMRWVLVGLLVSVGLSLFTSRTDVLVMYAGAVLGAFLAWKVGFGRETRAVLVGAGLTACTTPGTRTRGQVG